MSSLLHKIQTQLILAMIALMQTLLHEDIAKLPTLEYRDSFPLLNAMQTLLLPLIRPNGTVQLM